MSPSLGKLLLDAFNWFDDSLLASLAGRGWPRLTRAQSMIFSVLDQTGTRTAEIARRLGITRQAAHQTIRDLERLELVEQIPDPTNASAKLVLLTRKGRRISEDAREVFAELEAALARRIGETHAKRLRRALETEWGPPAVLDGRGNEGNSA